MHKILLVAAVWQELDYLVQQLKKTWNKTTTVIKYKHHELHLKITGIGAVNAALATTHSLTVDTALDEVWMVGCCGSYQNHIGIGDVVVATHEINGDLGIMTESGWQPPTYFPFSILDVNNTKYYNQFICKFPPVPTVANVYQIHSGVILTSSTVSGCYHYAKMQSEKFQAIAENMEGAAVAQVATYFNKPFVEIRGVSNIAGERDKSKWDFDKAFRNSNDLCLKIWEKES